MPIKKMIPTPAAAPLELASTVDPLSRMEDGACSYRRRGPPALSLPSGALNKRRISEDARSGVIGRSPGLSFFVFRRAGFLVPGHT